MSTNEDLKRTVAWLETWVEEHSTSRAADRVLMLLTAYKAMGAESTPVEEGVPVNETALKYVHIRDELLSRIPPGSVWASMHDENARVLNYALHLYHSHTLGCVECFGGVH